MIFNVGVPVRTRTLTVTPPTVTVGTYTYNGSPQGPTISPYDSNIISVINATGTDAGTYNLTISLKNKITYRWDDDSTVDKVYQYTIDKIPATITTSANSVTLTSGDASTQTITVSSNSGVNLIATSANNKVVSYPTVTNGYLVLDASHSISGTTTVTITSPETTNYEAATKTVSVNVTLSIATWASGTIQQIAAMLRAHYAGIINIHNYWQVGDSRTISLNAVEKSQSHIIPSMPAQNLTFILMHSGGKLCYDIKDPNDSSLHQECAFVVGAGSCLNTASPMKGNEYPAGYGITDMCMWLAPLTYISSEKTFRSMFPDSRYYDGDIFKRTYWYSAQNSSNSTRHEEVGMFGLPSEKEIFGYYEWSDPDDSGDDFADQFSYYYTISNRKKKLGISGSYTQWWTRSIKEGSGGSAQFSVVTTSGYPGNVYLPDVNYFGICPHTII